MKGRVKGEVINSLFFLHGFHFGLVLHTQNYLLFFLEDFQLYYFALIFTRTPSHVIYSPHTNAVIFHLQF